MCDVNANIPVKEGIKGKMQYFVSTSGQLCLYTHLSENWQAVQLLPGWDLLCARHGQPVAHDDCLF